MPPPSERRFAVFLTATYGVAFALLLSRHEMWRDELQAWLIARDSRNLLDLFHNVRYEGHGPLWYWLLYPLTRLTHYPRFGLLPLQWLIATASAFTIARHAPFTRLQRTLLVFGYYSLFEYGVFSRNYALAALLIFLLCTTYSHHARHAWRTSLLLSLLALTHVYGLIFSAGFALLTVFSSPSSLRRFVPASLLFLAAIVFAALQMIPPPDSGFAVGWYTHFNPHWSNATLSTVYRSYIPLPKPQLDFWNTNVLQLLTERPSAALPLSFALIGLAVCLLRRNRRALFFYAFTTVALLAFTYVKYFGFTRHWGHLYLAFLASVWISRLPSDTRATGSLPASAPAARHDVILTILFGLQSLATLYAVTMDATHPLSASRAVAGYLKQNALDQLPLIGSRDEAISPVTAYLDHPAYFADSNRLGTFMRWDQRRVTPTTQQVVAAAQRFAAETGQGGKALLVLFSGDAPSPLPPQLEHLQDFTNARLPDERYHLYRFHP